MTTTFKSESSIFASAMLVLLLLLAAPSISRAASAVDVSIGSPAGIAADTFGNVYFSSPNLVYKLDRDGDLTRVAGRAVAGYSGDGGPAALALLNIPLFDYPEIRVDFIDFEELTGPLAVDAAGNLYIGDAYNDRVRKVDRSGTISTVAEGGWPQGVAVDPAGNLYVAYSSWPGYLQRYTPAGDVTLAGTNCGPTYLGPGLCAPEQIAVDTAGNVYVPDGYCRIRKVSPDGSTVTVAGADDQPSQGFVFTCGFSGDGGPATRAALAWPFGVALDADNNLYIADTYNHCIRKVDRDGVIRAVAGQCGKQGYSGDGGPATRALLDAPHAIAIDFAGNIYIADTANYRIRKVSPGGVITTIAGNGGGLPDELGPASFTIGPALTGSWYDPTQSGHGLFIEVLPGNRFSATWAAYHPAGGQAWFTGVGTYSGNTATVTDVMLPSGGAWIPKFDSSKIVRYYWGTLSFVFDDCDHGVVHFDSAMWHLEGTMQLTRLTQPAGLSCP